MPETEGSYLRNYLNLLVSNFIFMAYNTSLLVLALQEYGVSESDTTTSEEAAQPTTQAKYHLVNKGDTLYSLSNFYKISINKLRELNSLGESNNIIIGQQLKVSESEPPEYPIRTSRIMQYAKECGMSGITSANDAWCSLFMNWLAYKCKLQRSNSLAARSWLDVGVRVFNVSTADVVVFYRDGADSPYGHVGIPVSFTANQEYIYVLGGNQSNMVCIKPYAASRLLGFRQLKAA